MTLRCAAGKSGRLDQSAELGSISALDEYPGQEQLIASAGGVGTIHLMHGTPETAQ
jgi:hypothetical protein